MKLSSMLIGACSAFALFATAQAETVTIATVNNGDMVTMKGLADDFTKSHPGIELEWVVLDENTLRQRVTTDIATKGGQFDVMIIGAYEVPIWANRGWLVPLTKLQEDEAYDANDLVPSVADALSVDGKLYAAPFYAESSMLHYRKDLVEAAGLTMPNAPTWEFIGEAARKMTDREKGINGICLRGLPGWGQLGAVLPATVNSFGGRLFDEDWNPQFDQPEWHEALQFYVDILKDAGPAGSSSNGYAEIMALFQQGKCAMWMDATVAASGLTGADSTVADKMAWALAPNTGLGKTAGWFWTWTLAIPAGTAQQDAAAEFIAWATSKEYTKLVAGVKGWAQVPPGTRTSLYENQTYLDAAPFAQLTIDSIRAADANNPSVKPVPYTGVQFAAIPEWIGIGDSITQQFSAAIAGTKTVEEALAEAQNIATREMRAAGYID
ncbi:MAG: sugar ABC transporter substrate-binding protein [OCS116 cluster bacterium]|uniref:Sugar ABC transporter substrate-binding protein n=1 Tax=OCS116 cluster bacterium TaxID=2030921 RepID=A0A2A4YQA2_9PROT|nr:sugar ABC transporter substrate-binding protein [OCS116 cluster bacterium]